MASSVCSRRFEYISASPVLVGSGYVSQERCVSVISSVGGVLSQSYPVYALCFVGIDFSYNVVVVG